MKKCNNCNVEVYENHSKCPLCLCDVGDAKSSSVEYPIYKQYNTAKVVFFKKLFAFITIVSIVICVYINMFTTIGLWSLTVIGSLMFVWCVLESLLSKSKSHGQKVLSIYLMYCVLLSTIDFVHGSHQWSTTYAIPLTTSLVAIYLGIRLLISKKGYVDFLGSILILTSLSMIPIIIYIIGLSSKIWSSGLGLLTCILVLIGIYVKTENKFTEEFKKKFHL